MSVHVSISIQGAVTIYIAIQETSGYPCIISYVVIYCYVCSKFCTLKSILMTYICTCVTNTLLDVNNYNGIKNCVS